MSGRPILESGIMRLFRKRILRKSGKKRRKKRMRRNTGNKRTPE